MSMTTAASTPSMYEITCSSCGKLLTISAGQAGSQLDCECGKVVDVPTIRELRRQFGPVAEVASKAAQKYDPRGANDEFNRKILLMSAICLIGIGLTVFGSLYFFQRSIQNKGLTERDLQSLEVQRKNFDSIPAPELWRDWTVARDKGLGTHQPLEEIINLERARGVWIGAYCGLGASGVGLLLLIFAVLLPRRRIAG
jgi:hypothetical protein